MPTKQVSDNLTIASLDLARDKSSLITAAVAASNVGSLSGACLPFIVSATINGLGLSQSEAGFLAGSEVAAVGISTIFIAPMMKQLSRARLALWAGVLVVTLNILSCLAESFTSLLLLRVATGFAAGFTSAASKATVADANNPNRFFAYMLGFGAILIAILMQAIPFAIEAMEHRGLFLVMAATTLLSIPLFLWLPGAPTPNTNHGKQRTERIKLLPTTLLIAASAIIAIALSGVWAFTSQLGVTSGLSLKMVGTVLALTSLCGVLASFLAAAAGLRFGRILPLAIGLTGMGLGGFMTTVTGITGMVFSISLIIFTVGWYFHYPYVIGTAAELDRYGRLPPLTYGVFVLMMSVGPMISGVLVENYGFTAAGWLCLLGSATAILFLWPISRELRNKS